MGSVLVLVGPILAIILSKVEGLFLVLALPKNKLGCRSRDGHSVHVYVENGNSEKNLLFIPDGESGFETEFLTEERISARNPT